MSYLHREMVSLAEPYTAPTGPRSGIGVHLKQVRYITLVCTRLILGSICALAHASLLTTVYGEASGGAPPPASCPQQYGAVGTACASGASLNLQANAGYGTLTATASVASGYRLVNLFASSAFTDTLTIEALGISSGFVGYSFLVKGSAISSDGGLSVSATQNGASTLAFQPYMLTGTSASGSPIETAITTALAPFTSGVPFSWGVTAGIDTYLGGSTVHAYPISDVVQVTLTGVSVFDASRHPVTRGVTLYSNSSPYAGLATQTPEPSPTVLVPLCLAGLIWAGRHRRAKRAA